MKKIKINFGKIAFLMCNFIFLLSGICLVLLGCVLINDTPRILLSRLVLEPAIISQPLLYYVALAFITAGLIVCVVAMLGCWASWSPESNWLMGTYMFLLIVLLLGETSFGVVASLCPQIVGVAEDRDQMVTALMNNYGVPGRSQYTVAVDLAQTLFECCGMQSGSDYDGSWWWRREQETQHDLRVPLSCCFLSNTDDENSFLDPKPINSSLCQAKTNSRYQYGRHVKGCIDKLNAWFKEHIAIFLIIGLALVIVQLAVLLCAILVCLRKRKRTIPTPSNSEVSTIQSKSSKKLRRSERNQTPRPERKNATAQIDFQREDNCFVTGKNYQSQMDFHTNSKPVNYASKKLNLNDDFGDIRGRDSPSSLPLVLRNEHFQKYDDHKAKQNSLKRNSPLIQDFGHYDQGSNIYFTPHYRLPGRRGDTMAYNNSDEYKLNGDLKNYFGKNETYGIDNSSRINEDQIKKDDCFEPEWVPSHQSENFHNPYVVQPWNIVGIPYKIEEVSKCSDNQCDSHFVKKAVCDIESGIYSSQHQDLRKEIVEEKIDISQAKLYWQEKERNIKSQDLQLPVTIDYRTDYPEEEREENLIVLKVEHSDGLVLHPNRPIILTPLDAEKLKKVVRRSKLKEGVVVGKENYQEELIHDYEKNWSTKRDEVWHDGFVEESHKQAKKEESERMEDVASRVLKFENTGFPNDMGQLKPRIPRVKTGRVCKNCKKFFESEKCLKCGTLKPSTHGGQTFNLKNLHQRKYLSVDSRRRKDKNSEEDLWISLDSQRSRTNFFGNSGSYTLRCNLNPVKKVSQNRKKFYLTPDTLQWGYLKTLKEPKIYYENFTAKKREFKKQNGPDYPRKKSEAVMW